MEFNDVLLGILLVATIVLVVFLIIVAIKMLYTFDKVNVILGDAEKKLNSLNGVFDCVDNVTNAINTVSSKASNVIISLIDRIFKK